MKHPFNILHLHESNKIYWELIHSLPEFKKQTHSCTNTEDQYFEVNNNINFNEHDRKSDLNVYITR